MNYDVTTQTGVTTCLPVLYKQGRLVCYGFRFIHLVLIATGTFTFTAHSCKQCYATLINISIFFKTNIGCRSFSIAAPTLWNSVPDNVKSANTVITFCDRLNTYLLTWLIYLRALEHFHPPVDDLEVNLNGFDIAKFYVLLNSSFLRILASTCIISVLLYYTNNEYKSFLGPTLQM